mgnify:CR=1 FL=1
MSEDPLDDRVERSTVILIVCGTIIAVMAILHMLDFLDMDFDGENPRVGEFSAQYLEQGEELRMGSGNTELHARCVEGFLVIASDTDRTMRGLLLDHRDRGIRCSMPMAPENLPEPTGE